MMEQRTFIEEEYEQRGKLSRRDKFLKQKDKILPWKDWVEMISPHYPKGGNGCPMRGLFCEKCGEVFQLMLVMHLRSNL